MDRVFSRNTALEEKGFRFRREDPEGQWLYVVEDVKDHDIVQAHVHVVLKESKAWKAYLYFRDTLRRDRKGQGIRKAQDRTRTEIRERPKKLYEGKARIHRRNLRRGKTCKN